MRKHLDGYAMLLAGLAWISLILPASSEKLAGKVNLDIFPRMEFFAVAGTAWLVGRLVFWLGAQVRLAREVPGLNAKLVESTRKLEEVTDGRDFQRQMRGEFEEALEVLRERVISGKIKSACGAGHEIKEILDLSPGQLTRNNIVVGYRKSLEKLLDEKADERKKKLEPKDKKTGRRVTTK